MKKEDIKIVRDLLIIDNEQKGFCSVCRDYQWTMMADKPVIKHEDWCPLKGKRLEQEVAIRNEEYGLSTRFTIIIKR